MKEFLKKVPLFSSLKEEELEVLSNIGTIHNFNKERILMSVDEEGDSLYIITEGRVKVSVFSESGKEIIFSILREGDFFGEMALLDGQPRSANITATEDSKVFILHRKDFANLLEKYPRISIKLLEELSIRLRKTDQRLESIALLDVTGRIATVLVQLGKEQGQETPEGVLIRSRPTHQEIANMVGTTRETVTRVLKQLELKGYIKMTGKDVIILSDMDLIGDFCF